MQFQLWRWRAHCITPRTGAQMTSNSEKAEAVEQLLDTPDLATALESEQFKKFLDQVPIAIAVRS